MPIEILRKTGTPIIFANSGEHSPAAANNLGARTDQIDLDGILAGEARQSNKIDFGAAWAREHNMAAAIKPGSAFIAGETVDFYLAFSPNEIAANANPGGISGVDSDYAGYSTNLEDSLLQLTFIGSMTMTVQTTVQIDTNIGVFRPMERYATLVVVNKSVADNFIGDAVEMSVRLAPIVDEFQN